MLRRGLRQFCAAGLLRPAPGPISDAASRQISTELNTALRPFYFAVHPDLFGQHPLQRSVNEDSLKQLSAHIELLYEQRQRPPAADAKKSLKFYIRDSAAHTRDTFKLIQITLDKRNQDPRSFIQTLLELCDLPTDYIRNVQAAKMHAVTPSAMYNYQSGHGYTYGAGGFSGFADFAWKQQQEVPKKSLDNWIAANADLAHSRTGELAELREEVAKLQRALVERLELRDVRYDCGWNIEHFRGCLKTLERLAQLHVSHMDCLRGRIVVFAPFTGVSLEGHVMLFTGDVLSSWIDFIKNLPQHDAFLQKIPIYENTLSQVLRKIRIGRRKFMPKQQAREYAGHLMKVTTTLGDYLTVHKFPKSWPDSLSDWEIVIESEAGPLMVNPTGQLIAPATCPGFMLVELISSNMALSKERTLKYREQKHVERELRTRCVEELQLKSLTKDDSVTPDRMIETLSELLNHDAEPFRDLDLHITNYYSVLTDGIVCIPWDFMSR